MPTLLKPEDFAKVGSEHAHQVAVFVWASQNFEKFPELRLMFAIPNGGERNKIVASNLKAEGVKSAVPDIFLPAARGSWHGLFVELKRPKAKGKAAGRPTDDQLKMHERFRQAGYGVAVAVGWEQTVDIIVKYLEWKGSAA